MIISLSHAHANQTCICIPVNQENRLFATNPYTCELIFYFVQSFRAHARSPQGITIKEILVISSAARFQIQNTVHSVVLICVFVIL